MGKPDALKPKLTEKLFMGRVTQAAKACGWMVYHTHNSFHSAKGFPDLCLVHAKRKLSYFIELKTETGKVTAEQQEWIDALLAAGHNAAVVRPKDWDDWFWDALRG